MRTFFVWAFYLWLLLALILTGWDLWANHLSVVGKLILTLGLLYMALIWLKDALEGKFFR